MFSNRLLSKLTTLHFYCWHKDLIYISTVFSPYSALTVFQSITCISLRYRKTIPQVPLTRVSYETEGSPNCPL